MAGSFNYTLIDHDGEKSSVNVRMPEVTDLNYSTAETQIATLISAVDAVTLCNPVKDTRTYVVTPYAGTIPASGFAQREAKYVAHFVDTGGNRGTLEIPGADLSLLPANSDRLDIVSAGAGLNLKNAIEALHLSKAGLAVTVEYIEHAGRNI